MKKKISLLIVLLGLVLSQVAFGNIFSSKKEDSKDKVYKIACDSAFAPFDFKKDGKYTGIDIQILSAISKIEGFEYKLFPMNFNGIIPSVVSNQLDGAISAMTITEARKNVLDFSDGYYEAGIVAVVKSENKDIKTVGDFKDKKFAVKKGTTGAEYAMKHQKSDNLSLRQFDDSASMFQEVIDGNADVAIEDFPVIAYKISLEKTPNLKIVGSKLVKEPYGFGVNKGHNAKLLKMFNEGLAKIKANGEYDKILAQYQ